MLVAKRKARDALEKAFSFGREATVMGAYSGVPAINKNGLPRVSEYQ